MNLQWIKSIISEPNGNGSSTRVITIAVVAFILGIGTAFGIQVYRKNITIEQFNTYLSAGGTFILTTCGPLYAANKTADWLKNKDNSSNNQQ